MPGPMQLKARNFCPRCVLKVENPVDAWPYYIVQETRLCISAFKNVYDDDDDDR